MPSDGRTPHGVRGLKCVGVEAADFAHESHPSRGAWIEIVADLRDAYNRGSHPSRGAWIEISHTITAHNQPLSRTPHGVRGLK